MELDTNIQNAASEGATPNEPETQQASDLDSASGTAPQDPTAANDDSARSGEEGADPAAENKENEPFLTFQYNHEDKALNRDEAINAAQIGLKYGEISEKLDRAAAYKGMSVSELVDSMISAERDKHRAELVEKLGDNEEAVERLMKLYDIEQAEKYQKAVNDKKAEIEKNEHTLNERLANEFLALKGEFPEYAEYGSLPQEVRREAEKGRDLMSALLLHQHKTNKAAAAQKELEAAAAKATAGSLSGESENVNTDEKNFLKGLWG